MTTKARRAREAARHPDAAEQRAREAACRPHDWAVRVAIPVDAAGHIAADDTSVDAWVDYRKCSICRARRATVLEAGPA
jgi:hypothetical protein